VFTDLAGEVQKSLGFYTNSNPNSKFSRIVAMGGGTRLRGLLKYLQQSLQIPVERPDQYKRLSMGAGVSAAKFHESVSEFAVVYGLALQGVGMARIESNLLPKSIERSMAWAMKLRIFNIAACLILLASLLALGRTVMDKVSYDRNSDVRREIEDVIRSAKDARQKLGQEQAKSEVYLDRMKQVFGLFRYRDVIPLVNEVVLSALPNARNNPEQRVLYEAFEAGDIDTILGFPRQDRKQLFVTHMWIMYSDDLAKARFGQIKIGAPKGGEDSGLLFEGFDMGAREVTEDTGDEGPNAGFLVIMEGYSPYREIGDLIDPLSVEDQPERWGFVTRLLHMEEWLGHHSSFILYKKRDVAHFKFDKGPVELVRATTTAMPTGIGVVPDPQEYPEITGNNNEGVLIDPMTKEVISRVPAVDRNGRPRFNQLGRPILEENDHWFRLRFKLAWKEAPEQG
jgi:type IV pilus assembly protein PilM